VGSGIGPALDGSARDGAARDAAARDAEPSAHPGPRRRGWPTAWASELRSTVPLAAILIVLVVFLVYCWWAQHPAGFQAIDEQEYSHLALLDWRAIHGGPTSLLRATDGENAPLVPFLASIFLSGDPTRTATVLVQIPFVVTLAIAAYSAFVRLSGRTGALVGTAATVFVPGILTWSRQLHFAVAATALLTAALAAACASEALKRRGWSFACGVFLGLAALARTMAVGLAPGLVLGLVIVAFAARTQWRTMLANVALLGAGAVIVAGPWYWHNRHAVFGYLVGNATSGAFADHLRPDQLRYWTVRVTEVGGYFMLPFVLVGSCVLAWGAVAIGRRRPALATAPAALWLITIALLGDYVVLTLTRNDGTGFALPAVPLVVGLVLFVARAIPWRPRLMLAVAAVAVCALDLVAGAVPLARIAVAGQTVIDGRGPNDIQLAAALQQPGLVVTDPAKLGRQMAVANCAVAERGRLGPVLTDNDSALFSPQSVETCAAARLSIAVWVSLPPCPGGLTQPQITACVRASLTAWHWPTVVTDDDTDAYPGSVSSQLVTPALSDYTVIGVYPIGRITVTIWARR
jgi:hypothetical protein